MKLHLSAQTSRGNDSRPIGPISRYTVTLQRLPTLSCQCAVLNEPPVYRARLLELRF